MLFPRGDRAPWLNPMSVTRLNELRRADATLAGWQGGRTLRVDSGFYKSQALEWVRS